MAPRHGEARLARPRTVRRALRSAHHHLRLLHASWPRPARGACEGVATVRT